jgi:hypothetical protein
VFARPAGTRSTSVRSLRSTDTQTVRNAERSSLQIAPIASPARAPRGPYADRASVIRFIHGLGVIVTVTAVILRGLVTKTETPIPALSAHRVPSQS